MEIYCDRSETAATPFIGVAGDIAPFRVNDGSSSSATSAAISASAALGGEIGVLMRRLDHFSSR